MSLLAALKPLAIQKQAIQADQVSQGIIQGAIMGPPGPFGIPPLEDLEDQLRVYRVSALVYRCSTIWAEETIQVPLRIFRRQGRRLGAEVLDGPVWNLLSEINGFQAWPEFLYVSMLHLALAGNAFWWKVRNRRGVVVELWSLKPTEIQIERAGPTGDLLYRWRPSDVGSVQYVFDQSSIVHLRIPSPLSDVWGLSPVRPAADDIRADQQAKRSTLAMLDNSSLPIGYLKSDQDVGDEQANMIRRQWREVYGGPANTGRVAVLGRGTDFKAITIQPKDIEYLNQRKLSRAGIINAFGIPPIYVGIESENFGNRREQRRQLWQDKLVPLFRLIEGQITERLLREFDPSYVAVLDETRTDIFVGIVGEQIETAAKAVSGRLMTPNEARRSFIAPFLHDVQGDVVGGNDFLTSMYMAPTKAIFSGETMDLFGQAWGPNTSPAAKAIEGATNALVRKDDPVEQFAAFEATATAALSLSLFQLLDDLARQIGDRLGEPSDAVPSEVMLQQAVPSWQTLMPLLTVALVPSLTRAFTFGVDQASADVGITLAPDPLLSGFLQQRVATYSPSIAEDIVLAFRLQLADGLAAGESITMLQARLMQFSDLMSPARALRVARTEMVNAANAGTFAGYRASGIVTKKQWRTSRDEHVRPAGRRGGPVFDHRAADGQIVGLDEPFIVSGEKLMYPGDTSLGASPGNVINERCTFISVRE